MNIPTVLSGTLPSEEKRKYWTLHVDEWKKSEISQEAYCTQAGIKYSTFVYWKGMLDNSGKKIKEKFLPVKVATNKAIISEAPRAIQIKLLSGHSVYLPISMNINDIGKLLHLLGEPNA